MTSLRDALSRLSPRAAVKFSNRGRYDLSHRNFTLPEPPMSYSIGVQAASKTDAILALEEKFATEVLLTQPAHEQDKDAAFANLRAQLALLGEPTADEHLAVSMNGYLSTVDGRVTTIGMGCSASVSRKAPAA